jgi:hypothetical protein
MGDEKSQILQMVADGVITADDGVKLLEALEKGERKRREREERPHGLNRRIIAENLGARLAEIGPMVRTAVCEAFVGVGDGDMDEIIEIETGPHIEYEGFDGPVDIKPGTTVHIRNGRESVSRDGELVLKGVGGTSMEVLEGKGEVHSSGEDCYVQWKGGRLVLGIPGSASVLLVSLRGSSVSAENLSSGIDLKTKGGSINLEGQGGGFCVKTMGGCIVIELDESWKSESKASTMGGSITLTVPSSVSADVSASAVGGEITVPENQGEMSVSRSHAGSKVRLRLGDDEEAPGIRLKTMGGSIEILGKD